MGLHIQLLLNCRERIAKPTYHVAGESTHGAVS